jgi:hypothetical protein
MVYTYYATTDLRLVLVFDRLDSLGDVRRVGVVFFFADVFLVVVVFAFAFVDAATVFPFFNI